MTGQGGLRDLVTAWRAKADEAADEAADEYEFTAGELLGTAWTLRRCADEVQAGLDKWAADLIRNVTADLDRAKDAAREAETNTGVYQQIPARTDEAEATYQRASNTVKASARCTSCGHLGDEHGATSCMARGCVCTRVQRAGR